MFSCVFVCLVIFCWEHGIWRNNQPSQSLPTGFMQGKTFTVCLVGGFRNLLNLLLSSASSSICSKNCSSNVLLTCLQWLPHSDASLASNSSQVKHKPVPWPTPRQHITLDTLPIFCLFAFHLGEESCYRGFSAGCSVLMLHRGRGINRCTKCCDFSYPLLLESLLGFTMALML